jgi:hypothetical protein
MLVKLKQEMKMTTKVTIDTHAGWPVEVITVDRHPVTGQRVLRTEVIPPKTIATIHIHQDKGLMIAELKQVTG